MTNALFAGIPGTPGVPTVDMLYKKCPAEFRRLDNPWHQFATKMRQTGFGKMTLKPKSSKVSVIDQQMACVIAVIAFAARNRTPLGELTHDSVAAWMFSEMLTEIPNTT